MRIEEFVELFKGKKTKTAHGWQVCCPIHDDSNPSASVDEGKGGRILYHCHGCDATMADVCKHFGLSVHDVMGGGSRSGHHAPEQHKKPDGGMSTKPKVAKRKAVIPGRLVASYEYRDAAGQLVLIKEKYLDADGKKTFRKKIPADPGSKYPWQTWNTTETLKKRGVPKPLYRLPELLHGIKTGKTVYFVEGEKDVETAILSGLCATTTDEGAGSLTGDKWPAHYTESFDGASEVFIIPDNDPPPAAPGKCGWQGQRFAAVKLEALKGILGDAVHVLQLPPELNGESVKDLTDYFQAGGTPADLAQLSAAAAQSNWDPPWTLPEYAALLASRSGGEGGADDSPDVDGDGRPEQPSASFMNAVRRSAEEKVAAWVTWINDQLDHGDMTIQQAVVWAGKIDWEGIRSEHRLKSLCDVVRHWINIVGRLYYNKDFKDFRTGLFFLKSDKSLCKVDSDWFRSWIARRIGINREEARFKKVWAAIQDELLQGDRAVGVVPEAYFARRGDVFGKDDKKPCTVYISCGVGRMARITAERVDMVDNGTDGVLFPVEQTLDPWTITDRPVDPFERCALWREMETATAKDRLVFILWALALPFTAPAKPPLCVTGGAGSGKTTAIRGLFRLYGMEQRNLTVETSEKGAQAFWASMNAGGLLLLDNMDTQVKWFANAAEAAATGSDYEAKRLYTDGELFRLKPRAWLAVTSLNPMFASSPALADRMMFVTLMRRQNKETKESEIYNEVNGVRNDAMTYLVQTVQRVLKDDWNGASPNRRHPDFGKIAVRIGRAIGRGDEAIEALRQVELDKYIFNIRNDAFGELIGDVLCEAQQYEFDAEGLLTKINERKGEAFTRTTKWNSQKVGKAIERLWESLRVCYDIRKTQRNHKNVYTATPTKTILRVFGHLEKPEKTQEKYDSDESEKAETPVETIEPPATPTELPVEGATTFISSIDNDIAGYEQDGALYL